MLTVSQIRQLKKASKLIVSRDFLSSFYLSVMAFTYRIFLNTNLAVIQSISNIAGNAWAQYSSGTVKQSFVIYRTIPWIWSYALQEDLSGHELPGILNSRQPVLDL